jgi:hypothetical protein
VEAGGEMMNIETCEGYKTLRVAVERDIEMKYRSRKVEEDHFSWVIARARHYAEKTGLEASDILDAWEKGRDYWHLNYYQEANQPEIKKNNVLVFESIDDFRSSLEGKGFRCPACRGISSSPTTYNTGIKDKNGKSCDWKSLGLFRTMGKGVYIYVKSELRGYEIFIPVAWEKEHNAAK